MWLDSPPDVYVYVDTLDDAGGSSGGNSDAGSSSGGGVAMVMPRW